MAAKLAGFEAVPVEYQNFGSEDEEKADCRQRLEAFAEANAGTPFNAGNQAAALLADNKIAEFSVR